MIFWATVLNLSDCHEDEIELSIYGERIMCFLAYCPIQPEINKGYDVEISLYFIDDHNLDISLSDSNTILERVDEGLGYDIYGVLKGNKIITRSITFEDDLLYDYSDFENKNVCLKVDRIDVSFL